MGVWTDKKIEQLKELWKEGISTAEIGKRLDFSKNAIVGKVNRLGLEHRTSPIKKTSLKSKVEQQETVKQPSVDDVKMEEVKNTSKNVTTKGEKKISETSSIKSSVKHENEEGVHLIDLTSDRCCWPIDDNNSGEFRFCGKKVFKGKPYCLEHCVMAYTNSSMLKEKDKSGV